jgi:hypothetical protein
MHARMASPGRVHGHRSQIGSSTLGNERSHRPVSKTAEAWQQTWERIDVRLADGASHVLYFHFE